ncbi:MAG: hypothetical protein ACI8QC_002126 [Planctomycetota bacterium]|jgi:hypothetical protein
MLRSQIAQILALLCLSLSLGACTITDEPTGRQHSYGSVVHGDLERVWATTQQTMAQVASNIRVDSGERRVEGRWNNASISVQVQKKTAMETILRVSAQAAGVERPDIAERLQIAIQQALMR